MAEQEASQQETAWEDLDSNSFASYFKKNSNQNQIMQKVK